MEGRRRLRAAAASWTYSRRTFESQEGPPVRQASVVIHRNAPARQYARWVATARAASSFVQSPKTAPLHSPKRLAEPVQVALVALYPAVSDKADHQGRRPDAVAVRSIRSVLR